MTAATPHRTNCLAQSASPYLLQHQHNPVEWYEWGPEALHAARELDRPILLSVGYAACHWCHVMAHESFEDETVAAVMNRLFINIKVDREERPDIDQIYMAALHAMGQQGGWPLTMFLTPDAKPFWGGTYFPKDAKYGRPAFTQVLETIAAVYHARDERVATNSTALLNHLQSQPLAHSAIDAKLPALAARQILSMFDETLGGLNGAPKFPMSPMLRFLLSQAQADARQDQIDTVSHTLGRICAGGIYDHIGGGFARYSVDEEWLVPHFEKMLYDNAQLIDLLVDAAALSRSPIFAERITETISWLAREMIVDGAFASSLDADSEGSEGLFYIWDYDDIEKILGPRTHAFANAYEIAFAGRFEGRNIPNRLGTARLSDEEEAAFAQDRTALFHAREARIRPGCDDKILTDWNGLMLAALARASVALNQPEWLVLAQTAWTALLSHLEDDQERLGHSYRQGRTIRPGLATDYAAMIHAAVELHQATFNPAYLEKALAWFAQLEAHYLLQDGAYALTADDAESLIVRPDATKDEATPSGNGVAITALARLSALTGDDRPLTRAHEILSATSALIPRNVISTASLLTGQVTLTHLRSVVILAQSQERASELLATARTARRYPAVILIIQPGQALRPLHPAFGKAMIEDKPTAYVCQAQTCSLGTTSPQELTSLLTA